ncbi:hypothetical protein BK133_20935 [Paenibacillus sp. FSL H8-0548]|nr:hypothetical protein BK133_20935 [Paenibacillus sp. FSL H8-0548]
MSAFQEILWNANSSAISHLTKWQRIQVRRKQGGSNWYKVKRHVAQEEDKSAATLQGRLV